MCFTWLNFVKTLRVRCAVIKKTWNNKDDGRYQVFFVLKYYMWRVQRVSGDIRWAKDLEAAPIPWSVQCNIMVEYITVSNILQIWCVWHWQLVSTRHIFISFAIVVWRHFSSLVLISWKLKPTKSYNQRRTSKHSLRTHNSRLYQVRYDNTKTSAAACILGIKCFTICNALSIDEVRLIVVYMQALLVIVKTYVLPQQPYLDGSFYDIELWLINHRTKIIIS